MGAGQGTSLEEAVNTASVRARNGWLTFLTLGAYLAIVIGGTTHTDLLLDTPTKLPILGVELPLAAFYTVTPVLFLLLHLNLLLQLYVLAEKFARWRSEAPVLVSQAATAARLDPFVFTQAWGGAVGAGLPRWLMWLVIHVTMIVAPIALLLAFQIRFLPVHSEGVTWWHRGVLLFDLAALWALWPRMLRPDAPWTETVGHLCFWASKRGLKSFALAGLTLCSAGFALLIATIPGESVVRCVAIGHPGCLKIEPQDWDRPTWAWTAYLFEGRFNRLYGTSNSLFTRHLVLSNQVLTHWNTDLPRPRWEGPVLRGRDLRHSVFVRADLRGADLTGATLRHANLEKAKLDQAQFGCADPGNTTGQGKEEGEKSYGSEAAKAASATGCADLTGANLLDATLTGANLLDATLTGVNLTNATLTGANLGSAKLTGANLYLATLTGANLGGATLIGADLSRATLTGADLGRATLIGADLSSATLIGANLRSATLTGADLSFATLTLADLSLATLTGADLRGATLTDADLSKANVWRSTLSPVIDRKKLWRLDAREIRFLPLRSPAYLALLANTRERLAGSDRMQQVLKRLQRLDPAHRREEYASWRVWGTLKSWGWDEARRDALTRRLIGWACDGPDARIIAGRLWWRVQWGQLRQTLLGASNYYPTAVAKGVLACAERIGLSADERANWKRLAQ